MSRPFQPTQINFIRCTPLDSHTGGSPFCPASIIVGPARLARLLGRVRGVLPSTVESRLSLYHVFCDAILQSLRRRLRTRLSAPGQVITAQEEPD